MKKLYIYCFVIICLFAFMPRPMAIPMVNLPEADTGGSGSTNNSSTENDNQSADENPSISEGQVVALDDDGNEIQIGKDNFFCTTFGPEVQFPRQLATIIHMVIIVMQVLVPIFLIIFGSIDFVRALSSQKEDEIKKGQQLFLKRMIAGILVFFVIAIVKLVISLLGKSTDSGNIISCVNCFIKEPGENQYQC